MSEKNRPLIASIFASAIIVAGALLYAGSAWRGETRQAASSPAGSREAASALQEEVIPADGVTLPARWGDLGKQLVTAGVIDEPRFVALYANRGGLPAGAKALLDDADNGDLVMTPQNAGVILDLLWALGLGNKDPILESGPMQDPRYGGAKNFASTGGWTIAVGNAMDHYDAHSFIALTPAEQALVEQVAENIYRPCCGNPTSFPDCNHGMAMLALLELMASQGVSETGMYKAALAANAYWFPDTYLTLASYFRSRGVDWGAVDPKTALGAAYSSAQGYRRIESEVAPVQAPPSGGCGA